MGVFSKINEISGLAAAAILLLTGIYLSGKTGFFQIFNFGNLMKTTLGNLFSKEKNSEGLSSLQSFITSLAGTIGVGNIVGVSAAIALGGAGSLFWMFVTALISMAIKYAEIFLSLKEGKDGPAPINKTYSFSPMRYIQKGTKSTAAAMFFAALGFLSSIFMGSMTQINAVSLSCGPAFGIQPIVIGIVLTTLFFPVILKGIKSVLKVTQVILPAFGILYLICGLVIIFQNRQQLPSVLSDILTSAFSFKSSAGGILGCGIIAAFKQGMMKGIFSNEAGLGSAGLAHGSCNERSPEEQGLWGALEVFLDTIVISGITGLIILCTESQSGGFSGVFQAFRKTLGPTGEMLIAVCILFFAVSSVLSWSYYGESCAVYLLGENKKTESFFRILFSLSIFFGAVLSAENLWVISELMNTGMISINLAGIYGLRSAIVGNPFTVIQTQKIKRKEIRSKFKKNFEKI